MNMEPTIADAPCPRQLLLSDYGTTFVSGETRSFIINKLQASHSPKTAQIRKTTANLGKDGLNFWIMTLLLPSGRLGSRWVIGPFSAALLAACGSPTPADAPPEVEEAEPATVFTKIVPVVYMGAGNECAVRLDEEFDGAITTIVGGPGGRPALAVCARIRDSGEWVVVDGVLSVENVAGEARVLPIPPDNGAHSRFPGHALTPTGVMAIRCKQFHLPDL